MKTSFEKEKKLNDALTRLKNFHVENDNSKSDFEILEKQKNQLEIEKKEISEKYTNLIGEHNRIKNELNLYKEKLQTEKSKETGFLNGWVWIKTNNTA